MRRTTSGRPHRFEPARLVLGLVVLAIAGLHVLRASGEADVPLPVLFALLPLGLACTAAVAVVALTARRARRRAVERGRPRP
ncbi:hypothetical protein [Streptomyces radicis]|uniref:Uncharacterized protein n=1 Tax=Streptomyces radicis TaxID=1750517 RepID=A0A3A9W6M8_9ACTN|nr:hypothetical protein [Streptomyces radicis]RKN08063.1 hypothetical protein D7319_16195 [Streptomyces radicis]RKN20418.1 hypothetical protein D7318_18055 [Streptomyces radicis]